MKLLLDTHILLWAAGSPECLSQDAHTLISTETNELFFSAASLWEIIIKKALKRDDFKVDGNVLRRELLDNGYSELPMTSEHVMSIDALPAIHKDPFDRMLVAQAIVEGITLLTADTVLMRYPGPIQKV